MRTRAQSLLFIFVSLASPYAFGKEDCPPDNGSTYCAVVRRQAIYEKTDKELNAEYQRVLKQLSKPAQTYIDFPQLKEKFIAAQRQWIAFRDAECDAWYVINEAGTGRNADLLKCLIERTKDRVRQLQTWQKETDGLDGGP